MTDQTGVDGFGDAEPTRVEQSLTAGLDAALDALDLAHSALIDAREAMEATLAVRLQREGGELGKLVAEVNRIRAAMAGAAVIIAHDRPLARSFQHGAMPWYETNWDPRLTPRQLAFLAWRAREVFPSEHVTYSGVMNEYAAAWAAERDAQTREIELRAAERVEAIEQRQQLDAELLADVESRPCPYCGAEAGAFCVTSSGRVGGPHAPRKRLSPLRAKYSAELSGLQRDGFGDGRPSEQRETSRDRERPETGKDAVARLIAEVASGLTPRYDAEPDRF
jgi:hypothetical protein